VKGTGRAETVFVLLLIQAASWLLAALSAVIAALAGQPGMGLLALLTVLLATATGWLGVALLCHWRRARRLVLGLEWICLVGSVLVFLLPGNAPGPVALLTGVGLPVCVLWLLHGKRARAELAHTGPSAQQLLL
jgi:O-antigen ligase